MTNILPRVGAVVSAAVFFTYCLPAIAQEKDELWETTMKMEMPGMPMQMPAQTSRTCVVKGANDESFVPKRQGECKTVDSKRTGSKYTFKMVCDGKNKMTIVGEMTYSADKYDGKHKMSGTMDGTPMEVTQIFSGKRVGDCAAK